uniref:Uncharacterized protein n=1 Tax=viral metagenome TaxID=1070528 RepID=A0A6C0LXA0_9ZZZZ
MIYYHNRCLFVYIYVNFDFIGSSKPYISWICRYLQRYSIYYFSFNLFLKKIETYLKCICEYIYKRK